MEEGDSNSASSAAGGGEINLFVAVTTHGSTEFNLDGTQKMFRIPERTKLTYIDLSAECGLSLQKASAPDLPPINYVEQAGPITEETIDEILRNIAEVAITTYDVLQQIAYLSKALEYVDDGTFEYYIIFLAKVLQIYSDRVNGNWVKTTKVKPIAKAMSGDSRTNVPLAALHYDSRQLHSHGVTERDINFMQWYKQSNEISTISKGNPGTEFPDYMYSYSPKRDLVTNNNNIIVITNTGEHIDEVEPLLKRPLSYVLAKLEEKYPGVIINVCVVSFACTSLTVDRHSVSDPEKRLLYRNAAKKESGEMEIGGRTRKNRRKRNNTRRKHNTIRIRNKTRKQKK
jgi:hypothetical protein